MSWGENARRSPTDSFYSEERLTSALSSRRESINESRIGVEDCVGVGGIDLFGVSLSSDRFCASRPGDFDDVQHYITLGIFLLLAIRNPLASRSLIAFTAWSSFAHAVVMGTQAMRNMISREELVGVVGTRPSLA